MPRIEPELQRLQEIKTLPSLLKYLKEDLNWPIGSDNVEEVTFDYDPAELGFDSASTAKIDEVRQLRPLTAGQKWGIFWVKFGKKQLPVQMLRRALGNLVVKKRASTKKSDKAAWHMHDLLFISAYGDDSNRHITFAHFSESEDSDKTLPVLKVLGWDEDDTVLHLKDTYKTLLTSLNWETTPTNDPEAWRDQWSSAFKLNHREVINTTKELVVELAHLATVIKNSVLTSLNAETEKGPWKKLMLAFQKTLIKDLNEEQFADVIAQTISYGLLTARLSSDGQISLKNLVDMVPSTNPFLKELLQHFLTSSGMKGLFDVDEAGINDVVELLNRANAQAIRNDFGKKTDGEDPVIHFYEHFLGAYNKKLKIERGVFYTPKPIVSYIVRSVHELLQKEFGLADGLADTSTWAEVKEHYKDLKIPEGIKPDIEPFVQILDPATGTATFLIEVIDVIHNTLTAKWDTERVSKSEQIKKWNTYVPTHLLPRLYAYELMMAPYAIAHMKLGLKLTETGFTAWEKLGSENRANIFLTNALEPWKAQLDLPGFTALAHESAAVSEVKRTKKFTVVIGNPPYSVHSSNNEPWVQNLISAFREVDGKPLGERNSQSLQDDYVKFLGLATNCVNLCECGIVGFITPHGFLDNPTFRGMRQQLLKQFTMLQFLDLHGNVNKKERCPDGTLDQNIFDILQGTAISVLVKAEVGSKQRILHSDLWGVRSIKYHKLGSSGLNLMEFPEISPQSPHYLLVPRNNNLYKSFSEWTPITELMPVWNNGLMTSRDDFVFGFNDAEVLERVTDFASTPISEASKRYGLRDVREMTIKESQAALRQIKDLSAEICPCLYRPMDVRSLFYNQCLVRWPTFGLMRQMSEKGNIGLVTSRMTKGETFAHVMATRHPVEKIALSSKTSNNAYLFPLLIREGDMSDTLFKEDIQTAVNLSPKHMFEWFENLGITNNISVEEDGRPNEMALNVFGYFFAILHSPSYRRMYADFLRGEYPRIPLTSSNKLFKNLAKIGIELTKIHLMEASVVKQSTVSFSGRSQKEVSKITWRNNAVWIDKEQTVGFMGINEEVWNFHIGGYQVCEKWLKDRKGRKLSKGDIEHYQKIVVALSETIRLMAEIDKVIDEHGGWPGAFQATK